MNQESNWANFRMPTWEDDISLNHDSTTPFNNFPSPSEMPIEEFKANDVLTPDLLGDTPLEDFVKRDTFPIPDASDREGYNPNFNA